MMNTETGNRPYLRSVPTAELVEELKTREGVEAEIFDPFEQPIVTVASCEGRSVVLIVRDGGWK